MSAAQHAGKHRPTRTKVRGLVHADAALVGCWLMQPLLVVG